jgi:propanol-preferring alcohol dehydrogenase
VDISDEKLARAKSLGAAKALNNSTGDAVKEIRKAGGAHVALVCSAAKAAYDAAFNSLRPTGTLLAVGLPAESICFPPIMMAAREVRIKASSVGTRADLRAVLAMAAAGKVHCDVTSKPLEFANEALELLRTGQVAGRMVLTFPA